MGELAAAPSRPRPTGFDLLRIAAAAIVIVDHSFLLRGSEPVWLSYRDYGFTPGRLAVIVFFAVSGYLISGSWLTRPGAAAFAGKRLRRIYPALTVMVVLSALVVGPIETVSKNYLTNPQTAQFVVRNLLIFPYDYHLPGVFHSNPTPAVNGVLWTLGVEVLAYLSIIVIGSLRLLDKPWLLLALGIACLLGSWPEIAPHGLSAVSARLGLLAAFYLAAAFRAMPSRRPNPWVTVVVIAAAAAGSATHAPVSLLAVPALVCVTLLFGLTRLPGTSAISRLGDPSYGMYVYGYVIQQVLIAHGVAITSDAGFVALSLVIAAAAGYVSWHLLEKRVVSARRPFMPRWLRSESASRTCPSCGRENALRGYFQFCKHARRGACDRDFITMVNAVGDRR